MAGRLSRWDRWRGGWRQLPFWPLLLAGLLALTLALAGEQGLMPPSPPAAAAAASTPALAPPPAAPPDLTVTVGMHVKNIYGLSLEDQTFKADGWYWLRVPVAVQELMARHGVKPLQMVEFVNQVDNWDAVIQPEDAMEPAAADGSRLLSFRFAAKFYVSEIDQHRSPFELIRLPIVLETGPSAFADPRNPVRLQPELQPRGVLGDDSSLYGYQLRRATLRSSNHLYATDFGTPNDNRYSRITLEVEYAPQPWAMFIQWILPMLLVMTLVLLAPSLEGSLGDARLAIPPTALLTLVFLQQTYKSALPPTAYPTFLDQLYTYGYLVSVGLFVLFLWGSNQLASAGEADRERVMRRINRVDLRCQVGAVIGFALVALISWNR